MMQHFALNLDTIVSMLSMLGQFWSQSVFVSTPQGTQDRKDLAPASMNFQDGFEQNSASHSVTLLRSLLHSRVS
jgi:hypothetical protein